MRNKNWEQVCTKQKYQQVSNSVSIQSTCGTVWVIFQLINLLNESPVTTPLGL